MTFNSNLIPWKWGKKNVPVRKEDSATEYPSFFSLQQDINRVFDNFFRTFESGMMSPFWDSPSGAFQPRVEVKETDNDLHISFELPGLDEKDLDVSITDDALSVSGEKREEKEENTSGYYRMERTYGSFRRQIPFPCPIDKDKAEATFKRGVLTVKLPKAANAREHVKRITIKSH
ncbi:MAG TPA: Hsp20/alpha crystallin family protein [Candidatus Obscuribacterales bacterium]